MSQFNDARFAALRGQGFDGSTNDMLLQWAQAFGATSNQLNDAILEMLLLNGATSPHINDAWYQFLVGKGFGPSHRNDMEFAFWEDGGIIGPVIAVPTGSWAGGNAFCIILDVNEFTIAFSLPVVFTPVGAPTTTPNGLSITVNASPVTINSSSGSGTDTWSGVLAVAIQPTDVVALEYIGPGLTDQATTDPLETFGPFGVNNCNDGSGFGPGFGPGFD